MEIERLYGELDRAYSPENLNRLSSNIIALYKLKDISKLRRIHALMYNGNQATENPISRIFSKIITQYHPDRQEQISRELRSFYDKNDFTGLKKYDHILQVQEMDLDNDQSSDAASADFEYGDIWDYFAQGYSYIDDEELEDEYSGLGDMDNRNDFAAAVKRNVYGHLQVEFPYNLLADLEIVEMAEYEIEDLFGVEYCVYARIIDLSGNNLTQVSELSQLMRLEEIYLQDNHINYLDGLHELPFLRVLDLSNNDINDISPLFDLDSLEFLNIMGNRVPAWQIEKLSLSGVVVVA
ncbi:MAG: leucine-rich repeat domain-containing protein [Bacteroidales bacterium]|nr:leucine-rich repeat domain-containing protein [Bacteroidales bacterium]